MCVKVGWKMLVVLAFAMKMTKILGQVWTEGETMRCVWALRIAISARACDPQESERVYMCEGHEYLWRWKEHLQRLALRIAQFGHALNLFHHVWVLWCLQKQGDKRNVDVKITRTMTNECNCYNISKCDLGQFLKGWKVSAWNEIADVFTISNWSAYCLICSSVIFAKAGFARRTCSGCFLIMDACSLSCSGVGVGIAFCLGTFFGFAAFALTFPAPVRSVTKSQP